MSCGPPLIAHAIHRLDIGGLENGLVNIVNRMPADRYRHVVLCLAGYNPEYCRRLHSNVEVISLDKRPGKDFGVYLRTWRALRRLRPAIFHTRNLGTIDLQWVAAFAGVRCRVHGEHGWEASDPSGLSRKNLRIRRACRPVIDRYVPMSRDIETWLCRSVGVRSSNIRQLYNGVDTDLFRPVANALPIGDMIVIGTVGRLDPIKNHNTLLTVLSQLRPRLPALRLTIVGTGPERSSLEAQARRLNLDGLVNFTGARDDIPDLMRTFSIFVLPSINEGISNTLLEAMATGLPVIASSVGGNPEVVVDGVTGVLCDPKDPDALANAILNYVVKPEVRVAHGRAARERAVRTFGLDSMVLRYLALYDELMNRT